MKILKKVQFFPFLFSMAYGHTKGMKDVWAPYHPRFLGAREDIELNDGHSPLGALHKFSVGLSIS